MATDEELIAAALRQETPPPGEERSGPRPPERLGPYRIRRQIGTGGMGVVYEAEQEHPVRRRVALKVIKLGMDTREVVARFEVERQALALMNHPNIAKVYDAGATEQGRPYFAMEYIAGTRLTEYCGGHGLALPERLELFMQVCQAIQHAHQKGIIHRDIKPSNVLVAVHDDRPVPKVIDFGVAKAIDQRLTEKTIFTAQGQPIGTPEYMSPEQLEMDAGGIDTRTDIYSLGVLLYELLVGVLPYGPMHLRGRSLTEIQRMLREREPPKPSARLGGLGPDALGCAENRRTDAKVLRRQLRGDLDWITMKTLEKDRTRRYAGGAELAADIQRHLNHEPVLAGPPSTAYRVRKFVRRNRGLVAGATALLVVLVAGIVASTTFALREARAHKQALWQAYLGSIAAANAALDANDVGALRRYLDQTPAEFRNWEWRYLDAASDQSLAVLRGHEGDVWSVAFSPDGTLLSSGAEDKTIRLRDMSSDVGWATPTYVSSVGERYPSPSQGEGRMGVGILRGHEDFVYSVAFSPDGQQLASASHDQSVRIWDVATGKQLNIMEGHTDFVRSVAFSRNNTHVASGSKDGTVRVWDAATGKTLRGLQGHKGVVQSVAFSPDGTTLATAADDGTLRLWDSTNGEELTVFRGHIGFVQSVAFSPDGQRLASACRQDRTLRLWSISMRKAQTVLPHKGEVGRVTFSADGTRLVSPSRYGGPGEYLWDIFTGDRFDHLGGKRGQLRRGEPQLGRHPLGGGLA